MDSARAHPPPTLVDAAGTVHEPAGDEARIVCLVPSITELICDLGLTEQLVGRTGFCIHPWDVVRTIPKVGGTKDVKLDRVRRLAPTHAVLNIDENTEQTATDLAEFVPHIVVTHPQGPRDNLELYRLLGAVFGADAAAQRLCAAFEEAYDEVADPTRDHQNVLYLIWRDPWMTVARDTYISQTLALVNWHTQPGSGPERYPEVDLASLSSTIDRVLLSSEPYHFHEHHRAEIASLVSGAEVTLIDGEMTSWYGSRAIQGLRYLADYAHAAGSG